MLTICFSDSVSAAVTDGVTVGHTCCSVEGNCMIPLASPRDRFCPTHSHKKLECFVQDCAEPAQPGHASCLAESHRALEISLQQRNRKALTELRRRLKKAGVSSVAPAGGDLCTADVDASDNPATPDTDTSHPQQSTPQPSPAKGRTSRKYTHNEQLCVKCCGIIISRATFYHAEGVAAVKVCPSRCHWSRH